MPKTKDGSLPLNYQEKAFIKNVVQTKKIGESALRARYSHPSYGTHLMKKPKIRTAIQKAMEKQGISTTYAAKKLKEGCEAMLPPKLRKDGTVAQPEYPDFFNRRPYVDMVLKLGQHYPNEKIEIEEKKTIVTLTLNVNMTQGLLDSGKITQEEAKQLKEYIEHEPIRE